MLKKSITAFGLALTIAGAVTTSALAAAPWSLSGSAIQVKAADTPGPNPWVVEIGSNVQDEDENNDLGGAVVYVPNQPLTLADITELSADYNITDDDCGGGSPRFGLGIDSDGDGEINGYAFVYLGPGPNYTGCESGWQETGNLVGLEDSDTRYDLIQLGGTFYDTYNNTLAQFGDADVVEIVFAADAGWFFDVDGDGEQTVQVDNIRVNHQTMNGANVK
jgi:hypothetical protein